MGEVTADAVVAQVKANVEEQLAAQLAEKLPAEVVEQIDVAQLVDVTPIVNTILAGQQEVANADPVDTIRISDDGATARRVQDASGRTYWVVTQRNGETYHDLEPTLPWTLVYAPEPQP